MSRQALWSGRFEKELSDSTLSFTSSLSTDERLAWYDVVGSIAHAKMLGRQKIIDPSEARKIVKGLEQVLKEIELGDLELSEELEDIHTNIELILTKRIGEAGARLHTARSRNDQIVTDLRMYLRDSALDMIDLLTSLQYSLAAISRRNVKTVMPGFTHMQHAQPITLAHHLMAHFYRMERDVERFLDSYKRINVCPLGSGALAGTTFDIDREQVSDALGFYAPCKNAMDGVADRDFVAEFMFASALTMAHLSSICEELVLWSTPEFGFVEIDEMFSTGSSIMPQKKNPDVAELVRGKAAGSIGDLVAILVLLKGLPLAYNRDLQEDKASLFDSIDALAKCLGILTPMLDTAKFDGRAMLAGAERGYLNATDLADYLARKGVPFRKAHEVVGKIVRFASKNGKRLEDLSLLELRRFSKSIEGDVSDVLPIAKCVEGRNSYGGTSPSSVRKQLLEADSALRRQRSFLKSERERIGRVWQELL
ncbi:MAG: argininosuccinate lyase [Methanomassiliicoccales archaeon]|nr:argininosuccinate lyase [Methanomassiliicoccales archaeon]